MEFSITYYSILIYIILIVSLVIMKPSFIYDDNKKQYREFGNGDNQTYFTLPVLAILIALVVATLSCLLCGKPKKIKEKIKYIQMPYPMYHLPQQIPDTTNT
jgi:hypothetical protein